MSDQHQGLADLDAALCAARPAAGVYVVGLTGSVASGKSTLAAALLDRIRAWDDRPDAELVSTDGFLHPNAVLEARGILGRKGFPETYDVEALKAALAAARTGAVTVPGYSHVIYDIDPTLARRIDGAQVLLVEGLGLHHDWRAEPGPPLDALIYLDADEADLQAWYVERFVGLWAAAADDPSSFYARFRAMDEPQVRDLAAMVWTSVNLPNLRENIILARDLARIVVRKGPGHEIVGVEVRG